MRKELKSLATMFLSSLGMLSVTMCVTCAHPPSAIKGRALQSFGHLSSTNQNTVQRIANKISKLSEEEQQRYYNKQLNALLSTPTATKNSKEKKKFAKRRKNTLSRASENAKRKTASMPREERVAFLNAEEEYETYGERNWESYQPDEDDAAFLVDRSDPTDILVRILVYVDGKQEVVEAIHAMEDAIEKHLNIPGFSVNLIFVPYEDPDAFTVESDLNEWITSHNWGGTPQVLAHELLHLMGLSDEYDGIASHAQNEHLSMSTRLWYFEKQLSEPFLPDAKYGIMCDHNRRPLDRHACAAVGLDVERCVAERDKYY